MALRSSSLLLYGLEIMVTNQWIDFKAASSGPTLSAQIPIGYYSLEDLGTTIAQQMQVVDPANIYSVSAVRTFSSGTQNRVTISTSGTFLTILFGSGPHAGAEVNTLIGFASSDLTGSTAYTGTSSAGTALISTLTGYNYSGPLRNQQVFGTVNVSASGVKEAIVFQVQQFIQVQFMYEPESIIDSEWVPWWTWSIQQRPFEFTPEITNPSVFYNVTLESTGKDGSGLGFQMTEMLGKLPFCYDTGMITMRIKVGE